jgi:hypothetical protein
MTTRHLHQSCRLEAISSFCVDIMALRLICLIFAFALLYELRNNRLRLLAHPPRSYHGSHFGFGGARTAISNTLKFAFTVNPGK